MGSGKDEFISHYGGFRFGESEEQLTVRMAKIDTLHGLLASGTLSAEDVAATHQRILELKGLSLDDEDEE